MRLPILCAAFLGVSSATPAQRVRVLESSVIVHTVDGLPPGRNPIFRGVVRRFDNFELTPGRHRLLVSPKGSTFEMDGTVFRNSPMVDVEFVADSGHTYFLRGPFPIAILDSADAGATAAAGAPVVGSASVKLTPYDPSSATSELRVHFPGTAALGTERLVSARAIARGTSSTINYGLRRASLAAWTVTASNLPLSCAAESPPSVTADSEFVLVASANYEGGNMLSTSDSGSLALPKFTASVSHPSFGAKPRIRTTPMRANDDVIAITKRPGSARADIIVTGSGFEVRGRIPLTICP